MKRSLPTAYRLCTIGVCSVVLASLGVVIADSKQSANGADSPLSGGVQTENGNNYSGTVDAKLGFPISGAPPQDLFTISRLTQPPQGVLAYALGTKITPEALRSRQYQGYSGSCSLVLRDFNQGQSITTYPIQLNAADYISGLQFFPHAARKILLTIGAVGDQYNMSALYILDTSAQKLHRIVSDISYRRCPISPDGRYIAYMRGGDVFGASTSQSGQEDGPYGLHLCVFDVKNEKETVVARGVSLTPGGWNWTAQSLLLYGMLPAESGKPAGKKGQPRTQNIGKPNIYQFEPKTGSPKMLLPDAWRPTPSLQSQKVAFFGSENSSKPDPLSPDWATASQGTTLSVFTPNGKRKPLNRERKQYPTLAWRDSKNLVSIKTSILSRKLHTEFNLYDTDSGAGKLVTTMETSRLPGDAEDLASFYTATAPPVSPLCWSQDNKALFVDRLREGAYSSYNGKYDRYDDIVSVNIEDGRIVPIGTVKNSPGAPAWFSE